MYVFGTFIAWALHEIMAEPIGSRRSMPQMKSSQKSKRAATRRRRWPNQKKSHSKIFISLPIIVMVFKLPWPNIQPQRQQPIGRTKYTFEKAATLPPNGKDIDETETKREKSVTVLDQR